MFAPRQHRLDAVPGFGQGSHLGCTQRCWSCCWFKSEQSRSCSSLNPAWCALSLDCRSVFSILLSCSCSSGHKTLFWFPWYLPPWGSWQAVGSGLGFSFCLVFWAVFYTSFETLQLEAKFSGDAQEMVPGNDSLSWLMWFLKRNNQKNHPDNFDHNF